MQQAALPQGNSERQNGASRRPVPAKSPVRPRRYLRPIAPVHISALRSTGSQSRPTIRHAEPQGAQMKNALAFMTAAALTAAAVSVPAQAHERWPAIPAELGPGLPIDRFDGVPYRCDFGPVYNFYHGAYYGGQPPAVFLGYAYRPYYRYAAYRVIPRTYFCR
jgi:hypothetical protein